MSAGSAGTRVNSVSPNEVAQVQDGCRTAVECVVEDTLTTVLLALVFVVGFVLPIAVLAFVHLREALSALREEREEAVEEGNAYAAFVRRVARMDPDGGAAPTASSGGTTRAGGSAGRARGGLVHGGHGGVESGGKGGLAPVIDAYRETVMAQAGRPSADDDAVLADMAAEFGEDLAATVRGSDRLTPQLRSALVTRGRQAADRREDLVEAVDREVEAVTDARSTFEEVDRRVTDETKGPLENQPYEELRETWTALSELEDRCESHLQRRQSTIHGESFNRVGSELTEDPALQSYLYEPLDVDFPVLSEGTDLLGRVREVRRRVESALAVR